MIKKPNCSLLIFFIALLWSFNAVGQDFTFDVPVRLSNLHDDLNNEGFVHCWLKDEAGNPVPKVGANFGWFNIRGGAFNGTVRVEVNSDEPWRARTYTCDLSIKPVGGSRALRGFELVPLYGSDTSLPAVWEVTGTIPTASQ